MAEIVEMKIVDFRSPNGSVPRGADIDRCLTIGAREDDIGVDSPHLGMLAHEFQGRPCKWNAASLSIFGVLKR
jgi:hypothetical protein